MSMNDKYRVLTVRHVGEGCNPESTAHTTVYLLDPGQAFDRFGGSSAGLVVKKTASMIVSYFDSAAGRKDTEYALNDKKALQVWAHLVNRIAKGDKAEGPAA